MQVFFANGGEIWLITKRTAWNSKWKRPKHNYFEKIFKFNKRSIQFNAKFNWRRREGCRIVKFNPSISSRFWIFPNKNYSVHKFISSFSNLSLLIRKKKKLGNCKPIKIVRQLCWGFFFFFFGLLRGTCKVFLCYAYRCTTRTQTVEKIKTLLNAKKKLGSKWRL